jgi:hypothetical protein
LGVTFTGLFYEDAVGFLNARLPSAINATTSTVNNPFFIRFTQPRSQAAFSLDTNPGTSTFEALLNGSVVDSFTAGSNRNGINSFYGFTGVTFDALRVTAGGTGVAVIDNIQLGPAVTAQSVPEPFSIIGTLVGGAAALRLRKKLADANKA